jgi:hypothetical protein
MQKLVKIDDTLVKLKSNGQLLMAILLGIGLSLCCFTLAVGAHALAQIAEQPQVEHWFSVSQPVAAAIVQIAGPSGSKFLLRGVAALSAVFGLAMLAQVVPNEIRLQLAARRANRNGKSNSES